MNPHHNQNRPAARSLSRLLAAAALFASAVPLSLAQSVVAPGVSATDLIDPSASQPGTPAPLVSTRPTPTGGLIWGPATLHPQISYRYLSTDGLQSRPGTKSRTDIQSLSPGLSADIGRHWSIRYVQTWSFYSSSAFRDSVDQAGAIDWDTQYEDWTLSASHDYSRTDTPMFETGGQTRQTTHASTFNALFGLSDKYALDTTLAQNLRDTDLYSDTIEWSVREMLHRRTSPLLDLAAGVEYSYTAIKRTADMGAARLLASATWTPVRQFNASAEVGLENRRIYSTPSATRRSPLYSATLAWMPADTTRVTVTGARSSSASFFENLLTETSRYEAGLRQTLFKHFHFNASYSRQETVYKSAVGGLSTVRNDDTDTASAALDTVFLGKLRTALTYQYTKNASDASGLSYDSNQFGLEIGYTY